MLRHTLSIVAIVAGIVLCTVLPFLPGRYDSLAVPLSAMAQALGVVGLLVVPIGVVWMAVEFGNRGAAKRKGFAVATLIASSLVWAVVSLVGTIAGGFSVGVLAAGLFTYATARVIPRFARLESDTSDTRSMVPA